MDHQEFVNLLPLAGLDRLGPDEARALHEHLRGGCAECQAELRAYREAGAALAVALEGGHEAEHRVWENLEKRLHANAAAAHSLAHSASQPAHADGREHRGGAGWWRGVALVAILMVLALVVYDRSMVERMRMEQVHHLGQLESLSWELNGLRANLKAARIEADTLHSELSEHARLDRILMAPDLQLTRLSALTPARGVGAIVAFSHAYNQAMIHTFGLPEPPDDKLYELWWITRQSGPVKAGTFYARGHRTMEVQVSPPPAGQRVMMATVTLEPAGGTSKPTGPTYLRGTPDLE